MCTTFDPFFITVNHMLKILFEFYQLPFMLKKSANILLTEFRSGIFYRCHLLILFL